MTISSNFRDILSPYLSLYHPSPIPISPSPIPISPLTHPYITLTHPYITPHPSLYQFSPIPISPLTHPYITPHPSLYHKLCTHRRQIYTLSTHRYNTTKYSTSSFNSYVTHTHTQSSLTFIILVYFYSVLSPIARSVHSTGTIKQHLTLQYRGSCV